MKNQACTHQHTYAAHGQQFLNDSIYTIAFQNVNQSHRLLHMYWPITETFAVYQALQNVYNSGLVRKY